MENINKKIYRILLTGGGTGGSVAPLLAIVHELKNINTVNFEFLWLGSEDGPEQQMVEYENIKFQPIASGKLRRYFSWKNFLDPFLVVFGFVQSLLIIKHWHPDLVVSAGSFVSVPAVWAAKITRIPVLIHQQDVRPGLANRLMSLAATVITVSFRQSLSDFGDKAVWTGNPVHYEFTDLSLDEQVFTEIFRFEPDLPIILIIGGGTGSQALNSLAGEVLPELIKFCQVVHLTGKDKNNGFSFLHPRYKFFEFLNYTQMSAVYKIADIVVSRCGMGVLTELSFLSKPAILIPMPTSHQEDNAEVFYRHQAAIVLDQAKLSGAELIGQIKKVLEDSKLCQQLSTNINKVIKQESAKQITEIILKILKIKQ
jgi:UDP-N-acetylglucosamine--N-acetylmuramyl-(pentapeptide) pyrophosphoryl-undecaprenol N-acetylglucosamine transferase